MISNLVLVVIIGCSTVNNTNNEIKISENKISKKLEPKKLTFSSKAFISNFTDTFKLPEGKHEKIELSTDNGNGNFKIKIPTNSEFKVIFKKSTSFKIIDNDATDGLAIVNMPESIMEGYIKVQDQTQSNSSDKLTLEDKLYYSKQDLSVISPSEKDKWYKLGSKPFPVHNDWHNDDGNDYILRFNNSGIKKAEMRWFKNENIDYPMNIVQVTPESGGVIDFKGIGKLEIPAGAVDKPTIISMIQELEPPEISTVIPDKMIIMKDSDYLSPMIKIEPVGLFLSKKAKLLMETNIERLGANSPSVIDWQIIFDMPMYRKYLKLEVGNEFLERQKYSNKDKVYIRINSSKIEETNSFDINSPIFIDRLGYVCKVIDVDFKPSNKYGVYDK